MLVQEDLRFPALVSSLFAERQFKINSLNAGCSGNTTHDAINILINHVLVDKPDYVVLMEATNDTGVLRTSGSYNSRSSQPLGFADTLRCTKRFMANNSYLAGFARKSLSRHGVFIGDPKTLSWRNDPSVADEVPTEEFRRRLNVFISVCKEFDVEPVLMTQPLCGKKNELTPDWANLGVQDRFNAVIREVGNEKGAMVIDLVRVMNDRNPGWNNNFDYHYDGMHANDKGSRIYAECIFDAMLPIIEQKSRNRLGARTATETQ
jgi:lysophospholipase L1-like esterase